MFSTIKKALAALVLITATATATAGGVSAAPLWEGDFAANSSGNPFSSTWQTQWGVSGTIVNDAQSVVYPTHPILGKLMRVNFNSNPPSGQESRNGLVFVADLKGNGLLGTDPATDLYLQYYVRFSNNWDPVKGGKLPGFLSGLVGDNSSCAHGLNPDPVDGYNGFSTRYMWREQGRGEIYLYAPIQEGYPAGDGGICGWREKFANTFIFEPATWYRIQQRVKLNTPGQNDGLFQVWVNGEQVVDARNILFREDNDTIEKVFFDTHFGGNGPEYVPTAGTYVDFGPFTVDHEYIDENLFTDDVASMEIRVGKPTITHELTFYDSRGAKIKKEILAANSTPKTVNLIGPQIHNNDFIRACMFAAGNPTGSSITMEDFVYNGESVRMDKAFPTTGNLVRAQQDIVTLNNYGCANIPMYFFDINSSW